MEAKRHIIVLLTVVAVVGIAVGYAAEEGDAAKPKKVSGTREANCLLKVTCDPAIFPLSISTLDYLMRTDGVAGKAGKEVLGLSASDAAECILLEEVPLRGRPGGYGMEGMGGYGMMPGGNVGPTMIEDPMAEYGPEMMMMEDMWMEGTGMDDVMPASGPAAPVEPTAPGENRSSSRQTGSSRSSSSRQRGTSTSAYGSSTGSTSVRPGTPGGSVSRYSTKSSSKPRSTDPFVGYYSYGYSPNKAYNEYGAPEATRSTRTAAGRPQTTLLVQLSVELTEEVTVAAAQEFMEALVENLEGALENAHGRHFEHIMNRSLRWAEVELELAQRELAGAMGVSPPGSQTHKMLEQVVDLSAITPEMPFSDAIETIRHAVDPPLQIVVMWRDLYDNVEVEQTSPVDIEGPSKVKLGTGLELLLRANHEKLGYEIRDDIITIATKGNLPSLDDRAGAAVVPESRVRALYGEKTSLVRDKQKMAMDLVATEARFSAIHEHISKLQAEAGQEVANDRVLAELEEMVRMNQDRVVAMERLVQNGTASTAELIDMKEKLARVRVELAKHKDQLSQSAGGSRIANYNDELASMSIDMAEKQAYMQTIDKRLIAVERELAVASIAGAESRRIQFARQQVEIAERRVAEVKALAGSIAEPSVVVIGAD